VLDRDRPEWQLPDGVSRGTWDYFGLETIATEYDDYFRDHPLLELDVAWVNEELKKQGLHETSATSPPLITDLGCGTARALASIVLPNARLLAIDMSQNMLEQASTKLQTLPNTSAQLRMNLVHLEALRDRTIDTAICLFSSYGMIRGRQHRRAMLGHVQRILKTNGRFLLHVHNRWSSLRDPGGINWLIRSYLRSLYDKNWEWGDRIYNYRGLPTMFLHSFSIRELKSDLHHAGLRIQQLRYLDIRSANYLSKPFLLGNFRAGGFFLTLAPN
jgi:ubiquinone/menaquinone biosynthesis C-methylase UbiE